MRILALGAEEVKAFAWRADSMELAACDQSGLVRLWAIYCDDVVASVEVAPRERNDRYARALAFAPDVDELLVAEPTGVVVRDGRTLEELRRCSREGDRIAYGGAGAWIAGEKVGVYDSTTFEAIARFPVDDGTNWIEWFQIVPDVDGDAILMGDDGTWTDTGFSGRHRLRDRELTIFTPDLKTVLRKRSFAENDDFIAATFDRTSRAFVFATERGAIVAWSADGASERVLTSQGDVRKIFACEARSFAVVGKEAEPARLLAWAGLFEGDPFEIDMGAVAPFGSVVPSPDGRWLAVQREPVRDPERDFRRPARGHIALVDLEAGPVPRRTRAKVQPSPKAAARLARPKPLFATEAELSDRFAWTPTEAATRALAFVTTPEGTINLDLLARALENEQSSISRVLTELSRLAFEPGFALDRRIEMGHRFQEVVAAVKALDAIRRQLRAG